MAVAGEFGVCFLKDSGVRDGQLRSHLLSRAFWTVDGTGENRAAWANLIRSSRVDFNVVRLICSITLHCSLKLGGVVVVDCTASLGVVVNQSLEGGLHSASRTMSLLLLVTTALRLVNVAVHPASQSWPTDTRVESSSVKSLVSVAAGGKFGRGRLPLESLCNRSPSGSVTCTGLGSGWTF